MESRVLVLHFRKQGLTEFMEFQLFPPQEGKAPLRPDHLHPEPEARLGRWPLASSYSRSSFYTCASWFSRPVQGTVPTGQSVGWAQSRLGRVWPLQLGQRVDLDPSIKKPRFTTWFSQRKVL